MKQKITYPVILLGYVLVVTLTPEMGCLDVNGPRFLSLALWNLGASIFLFYTNTPSSEKNTPPWYQNPILILYTLFVSFSVISLLQAINLHEGLAYLSRVVNVFIATILIFQIFLRYKPGFQLLLLTLTGLLIVESFGVLFEMIRFMRGTQVEISNVHLWYYNKNILAAAIFIKIAAALYFMYFGTGKKRKIGIVGTWVGTLAILFLSTRAFYLGLVLLLAGLIIFVILMWLKKVPRMIHPLLITILILGLNIGIHSLLSAKIYPDNQKTELTSPLQERMRSAFNEENNPRIDSWKRTLNLIRQNPWFGVGTGNWKIRVLEQENQETDDFVYMYKNHNDFLEITAETGIPGGVAYIMMILMVIFSFLYLLTNRRSHPELISQTFFSAVGMGIYSIDAFFNFPANRPEIQILFAIIVAAAASALAEKSKIRVLKTTRIDRTNLLLIVLLLPIIWISFLTVKSLQIQRMVKEDQLQNSYSTATAHQVARYPRIPDISCTGIPLTIDKARFLMNENKLDEAKAVLRNDFSSPYDLRKEYLLSQIYLRQENSDSALIMAKKVYDGKPLFTPALILYVSLLEDKGANKEAGDIIQQALQEQPNDSLLNTKKYLLNPSFEEQDLKILNKKAGEAFEAKDYKTALHFINKILDQNPRLFEIMTIRAYCYYFTQEFDLAIKDINQVVQHLPVTPELLQLRGECYRQIGQPVLAEKDLRSAEELRK